MKICSKCNQHKPLEDFYNRQPKVVVTTARHEVPLTPAKLASQTKPRYNGGYNSQCKLCCREYGRQYAKNYKPRKRYQIKFRFPWVFSFTVTRINNKKRKQYELKT